MSTHAALATTAEVQEYLAGLKANDCTVKADKRGGMAAAYDGNIKVLWAIQKGPGQPWIVEFTESDRVKWVMPEPKEEK